MFFFRVADRNQCNSLLAFCVVGYDFKHRRQDADLNTGPDSQAQYDSLQKEVLLARMGLVA